VLVAWRIGPVLAAATPDSGTINRTLLVETAAGRFVLRAYRHAERQPVEREHAVIAHVCRHGLPAVAPLPLPGGGTILAREGRFYALFPHAPGAQVRRGQLAEREFAAMGACLAALHQALRSCPATPSARRAFAIDRGATLAGIDELAAAIRELRSGCDFDRHVLRRLAARRTWVDQSPLEALPDLAGVAQQLIHGDYQETNLFFLNGRVAAIIDWDQNYVAPRAWEVVRALHLTCKFAVEPSRAFVEAYRAAAPLDLAELDLVARSYGLMRAHDLWLYRAIYLDGNDRLRQFVSSADDAPDVYVPIMDRWETVRRSLC
jgi:homoserine kinase type II